MERAGVVVPLYMFSRVVEGRKEGSASVCLFFLDDDDDGEMRVED